MQVLQTRIGQNGRVVIPAEMRHAMGLKVGDEVVMRLEAGEIRLIAVRDSVRHARELFRRNVPAGVPVVDELLSDRRRQAADE